MSIYNKPDLKINIGCNTPSYHKKINSMNFSSNNTGRNLPENSKKCFSKNKYDLKHSTNLHSENNVINYNNQFIPNSSINKVLTTSNLKNRRIEIDLNKNNSPSFSKFNKSVGDNTMIFRNKQSTSQNNINNKVINYNINNAKETNNKNKNSLNNINININISKKIISTYYNKSRDKKNLIVKKKSINSLNNSNEKDSKNKYYQINNNYINKEDIKTSNNNENIGKNQSERIIKKNQGNDSYLINYYSNQGKHTGNHSSLACFSTNSNKSTNTNNKNNNFNNSNIYMNNNPNYTRDDICNSYYSNRDITKKSYGNIFNKITKENKSTCLSQIQSSIGLNNLQGNINSIQNYLKYLNIGQKNKNSKNIPVISKNKAHKLSANNINYNHNNTETNIYNNIYNSTYNYETQTTFTQNNCNKLNDDKENIIPNLKKNKKHIEIKQKKEFKEINNLPVESPEELHYFYIQILQKGKKLNFEHKK